jgi:hypothetical protein
MKKIFAFSILAVLFSTSSLAQSNPDESQPPAGNQPPNQAAKDKKGKVTRQGCVTRSSGDFILMQSDPGNSYVLAPTGKIKLENYLGHEVEVTGTESTSMSTSTNFTRKRAGSSLTITLDSIKTLAKECGT